MRTLIALLLFLASPVQAFAQAPATRYIMIVVDFPTSLPTDAQYLSWMQQDAADVDTFVTNENSYGHAPQVTDTVYAGVIDSGPVVAESNFSSGAYVIAQEAQAAAIANGVDLTPYGWQGSLGSGCHCIYLFPQPSEFGATWSIGGYGNQSGVWIGGSFGRTWPPGFTTLAHELGHHIGLQHAHAGGCADGTPTASGLVCPRGVGWVTYEYGDNYDLMGQGGGQFNCWMKSALGWLTVTDTNADGDYLLEPLENQTGQRCLRFFGGRKGNFPYILEFRQPIGHDASPSWVNPNNEFNGVIVRYLNQNAWSPGGLDTFVIRMNSDTPNQYGTTYPFNEAALTVGQTFCDKDARRGFTLLSTSPAGALVRVGRCR